MKGLNSDRNGNKKRMNGGRERERKTSNQNIESQENSAFFKHQIANKMDL